MRFLFPYQKVKQGSAIILYGIGNVGKQFYQQLCQTEYCRVVGWTDQIINRSMNKQKCLIPINEILKLDFDYIVIAVATENIAKEIMDKLEKQRIDKSKIVWESNYEMLDVKWPENRNYFIQHSDFFLKIIGLFYQSRQQFGEGEFYQSYPKLGLRGQRPTQERIEIYGLRKILKKDMDVLDIGCNCGFFDLQIAGMVRSVTGLEINTNLVQIANVTKEYIGAENCTFLQKDFRKWRSEKKYNIVFAFAILCWISLRPWEMAERLEKLIEKKGYLLIESHNVNSMDRLEDFNLCLQELRKKGICEIWEGTICDDGVITRKFVLLQNQGKL